LPDQYLSLGAALQDQVPNPFFSLITSGTLAAPTVARGQLLRPFPQYTGVAIDEVTNRNSIYHSLQVKLEKRLRGGGTILASYTVAKLISDTDTLTGWLEASSSTGWGDSNSNNLRAERSLVGFDVPQRFVLSYVLDLPFGHGKRFLSSDGYLGRAASGWGIDGVATFQKGFPLVFTNGQANGTTLFGGGSRPNLIGNCDPLISGSAVSRLGNPNSSSSTKWFNSGCFTSPPDFTFGNEPRVDSRLRAQGINNLDLSLFKTTRFGPDDRLGLEVRTEIFNLFNRTQFAPPNTTCCSSNNKNFGVVTGTAPGTNPRLIQFGLKFSF